MAIDALPGDGPLTVLTASGASLASDLLVVATGNAPPRLPAPFSPALAGHPGVIADPADTRRLRSLRLQAARRADDLAGAARNAVPFADWGPKHDPEAYARYTAPGGRTDNGKATR